MSKFSTVRAICLLFSIGAAQGQIRSAHPHFRGALPVSQSMLESLQMDGAKFHLPFETPASIACVYNLVASIVPGCPISGTHMLPQGGSGMIVIVNAFDHPAAQDDLNLFSRRFGVPECNAANPCFRTVYATGLQPPVDPLWALNAADIIEYAHALAPRAQIVLVEAASASVSDLNFATGVANQYVLAHSPTRTAQMIFPFGEFEAARELNNDALFTTPGIVYLSGNQFGFDLEYPAASPNVIGIGVTGFSRNVDGTFNTEFASQFDVGGMSAFEPRPAYQDGIADIVGEHRGVPDVALIADPLHGAVLFYDSIPLDGFVGWQYSGNVGIAEGIWAAMINVAGQDRPNTAAELTAFYEHLGDSGVFRDITFGQAFGINARPGWDVLTGLGSGVSYAAK